MFYEEHFENRVLAAGAYFVGSIRSALLKRLK